MRKLSVFNSVTVDGFFTGANGDLSWAHSVDPEWNAFAAENAKGGSTLLFGRITYDVMASFWPTAEAMKNFPEIAEGMKKSPKVVFSRTMDRALWNNTRLVKDDMVAEVRKMKQETGEGMTILGSGSIVSQLAQEGLVDEFQIAVTPVVIGNGRTMFESVKHKLSLKLTKTRVFGNGNVLLTYEPAT